MEQSVPSWGRGRKSGFGALGLRGMTPLVLGSQVTLTCFQRTRRPIAVTHGRSSGDGCPCGLRSGGPGTAWGMGAAGTPVSPLVQLRESGPWRNPCSNSCCPLLWALPRLAQSRPLPPQLLLLPKLLHPNLACPVLFSLTGPRPPYGHSREGKSRSEGPAGSDEEL